MRYRVRSVLCTASLVLPLIAVAAPTAARADDARADLLSLRVSSPVAGGGECQYLQVTSQWSITPGYVVVDAQASVNTNLAGQTAEVAPNFDSSNNQTTTGNSTWLWCDTLDGQGTFTVGNPTQVVVMDSNYASFTFTDTTSTTFTTPGAVPVPPAPAPPPVVAPVPTPAPPSPVPVPVVSRIPTHFHTCAAMHQWFRYLGGVEKRGAHNKGKKLRFRPAVDTALYNREKSLDKDHDGIACEVV